MPVSRFSKVDLPAPLGPMMPSTSPAARWMSTPCTAVRPPKRMVRPRPSRTSGPAGAACAACWGGWGSMLMVAHPLGEDAARADDEEGDHHQAVEQDAVVGKRPQLLRDRKSTRLNSSHLV